MGAKRGFSVRTSRVSFSPWRYARRSSSRSTCWRISRRKAPPLGQQALQKLLDPWIGLAQRLPEPFPQGLEVQEVEV